MGFADYLSRHPKQKPPPPASDDTQYIINLINNFKFILTQNSINQCSATRTMTDKYQTTYLTANNNTHAFNSDSAFCLNRSNLQSPLLYPLIESKLNNINTNQNFKNNQLHSTITYNPQGISSPNYNSIKSINSIHPTNHNFQNKNSNYLPQGNNSVNVTTRSRPKHNTFEEKIIRRKRSTNKQLTKMNPKQNTIATQTDEVSNKGLGRSALRPNPEDPIFPLSNTVDMPQYRKNLCQVFGEEFLAEATQKDKNMAPIIKLIKEKDWETLKRVSPYFYSLKRDLAVTPSGCVLYDNRLIVPAALKQLVINTLHQTHPGQTGMLRLADLVWFPRIHRDVTAKAQSCQT